MNHILELSPQVYDFIQSLLEGKGLSDAVADRIAMHIQEQFESVAEEL